MKQYLAIMKRDYGATSAEYFWLSGPICSILFAALMTWWLSSTGINIKAWYFLGLTLFCGFRMLGDLDLSQGHSLGLLAPDFKLYQFNYSTCLLLLSCLITCAVFADSIFEFFVSSSAFWLLVSSMFFFVKKQHWKIAYLVLFGLYALAAFIMIRLKQTGDFLDFLPSMYAIFWSALSEPFVGTPASIVCIAVSYRNFLMARQNYLMPKEYDSEVLPNAWKKHIKELNFNVLKLVSNQPLASKIWGKLESRVLFGFDIGRRQDILYKGLFGANAYSAVLVIVLILLLAVFSPFLIFAAAGFHSEAIIIPICIFMLFYLVIVSSVISLEWITNRQKISELWLLDDSETRPRYMLKLAMLFAERIGRVSFMCGCIFLLLAFFTSDLKGLLIIALVATGAIILGLLLQMAYVLFTTLKVKNTGWLRYVTFVFTAANFVGWLVVMYFSLEQKAFWPIVLAIGVSLTACYASIKYWCAYDRELLV